MHVLITGAGRGIGLALVESYGASGATVTGTTRSGTTPLDVTDPAAQRAYAKALGERPVDVLICNAGIYVDRDQTLERGFPAAQWAQTMATNVTGVFLTVQAMLPALRRSDGARIAIIGSQMGSSARATGGSYIYRASKAAVLNLGLNLAEDLRHEGISVGIYHPGWVSSDMGGPSAAETPTDCARGLMQRIDALSLATTGCFETWDGTAHPI